MRIPLNSHVSKPRYATDHLSNAAGAKGSAGWATVIDACQSPGAVRSDCSRCNYEGRQKKGIRSEWERKKCCHASRPRRGVKQMTSLNLAHSACSLLRVHSFRDTSSRGVGSYILFPTFSSIAARVFVPCITCTWSAIKIMITIPNEFSCVHREERKYIATKYKFFYRVKLEIIALTSINCS